MDALRITAMVAGLLGLLLLVPWAWAWTLTWEQAVVAVVCMGLLIWGDSQGPGDSRPRGYGLPKRWH